MGQIQSLKKVSFEDIIDTVFKNQHLYVLINTLGVTDQTCLIKHTVPAQSEEAFVTQLINTNKSQNIIIYGRHNNDDTIIRKYEQLTKLGFTNLSIYQGGMFEWLMLQEIYGSETFPTTTKIKDILS